MEIQRSVQRVGECENAKAVQRDSRCYIGNLTLSPRAMQLRQNATINHLAFVQQRCTICLPLSPSAVCVYAPDTVPEC